MRQPKTVERTVQNSLRQPKTVEKNALNSLRQPKTVQETAQELLRQPHLLHLDLMGMLCTFHLQPALAASISHVAISGEISVKLENHLLAVTSYGRNCAMYPK